MKYPFKIEKVDGCFKTTFLQAVKIELSYDGSYESLDSFAYLIKNYFNLDVDAKCFELKNLDALRIKSSDDTVRAKFSRDYIELFISGEIYVSFEASLMPFMTHVSNFLSQCNSGIKKLSLSKTNVWEVLENNREISDRYLKETILSRSLLETQTINNNDLNIWEITDEEANTSLIVKYGFLRQHDVKGNLTKKLVLDMVGVGFDIALTKLLTDFSKLNNLLDSAYIWSVSDDVVNVMKSDHSKHNRL